MSHRPRRRALRLLPAALCLAIGLRAGPAGAASATASPSTVDRWAGRPRRLTRTARGGLLEPLSDTPLPDPPGVDVLQGRPPGAGAGGVPTSPGLHRTLRQRRARGAATLEWLIAAPVLLFVGLAVLQWGLLMQARQALRLGALEAAREASVSHADPQAALRGLARGLSPWLYGATDAQEALTGPLRAEVELRVALGTGRLIITQRAPTESAFLDWAEPARDAQGQALLGVREIPNDALRFRATDAEPPGGRRASESGTPVGLRSGQTLLQANMLRLQIDYAVPMRVPLAGPVLSRLARAWQSDPILHAMSRGAMLPVRVSAVIQMQSPARHAAPDTPFEGEAD